MDYDKDEQKINFYNNFPSIFGGFSIRFLVHFTSGRKALCIFSIINVIAWFLYFALKPNFLILGIIVKSVQGFLTGGFVCITPLMMTNICPEEIVGGFGCFNQFGIALGMVIFSFMGSSVD